MGRKKRGGGGDEGGYYWMDTYGDMVTLLLTFFVLLYSTANTQDSTKWEMLWKAIQNQAGNNVQVVMQNNSGDPSASGTMAPNTGGSNPDKVVGNGDEEPQSFEDLFGYLQAMIDKEGLNNSVEVQQSNDKLLVTFRNSIFFDGDKSALRQDGKDILDFLCGALRPVADEVGEIRTWGHTAQVKDVPDNPAFDDELSGMRAAHVCTYMRSQLEGYVSDDKQNFSGYGCWHPVVPYDGTAATMIQNRRVEILIAKNTAGTIDINKLYDEMKNGTSTSMDINKDTASQAAPSGGAAGTSPDSAPAP